MASPFHVAFPRTLPRLQPSPARNILRSITTTQPASPIQASATRKSEAPDGVTEPFQALSYHVHRTPSQQLPVYHLAKASGGQRLTRIRKIEGSLGDLRKDLKEALQLEDRHIMINQLTKHIIIKGWKRNEIARFLEQKSF